MMNDKLINKDIEKQCVLIDTNDLITSTGSRDFSDYKIKFNDDGTNNTSGFGGVFKNVIGFRLKKAIIRNKPIQIDSSNSTINIAGVIKKLKPDKYGFYNGTTWATLLSDSVWNTNGNVNYNTPCLSSVSFDPTTQKLQWTGAVIVFVSGDDKMSRLLGLNPVDYTSDTTTSEFPIDLSSHYIDVVVDEIPYIACKKNASGHNMIDRIPITASVGGVQFYQVDPGELYSQNYFFPITLSELNIKLYTDNNNLLSATNEHHTFEFEITMLKNNTFR